MAARHEPCGARWPEPYLHVELGPRGGGLHHPVHHSDEGLALAHLRHTGKERAQVSGDTRLCQRSPVQEPSGCKVPPPEMAQGLQLWPGAAVAPFSAFVGGKTRIKQSQLGADGTDGHELGQGRQRRGPAHRRTHGQVLALPRGSVLNQGWHSPAGCWGGD